MQWRIDYLSVMRKASVQLYFCQEHETLTLSCYPIQRIMPFGEQKTRTGTYHSQSMLRDVEAARNGKPTCQANFWKQCFVHSEGQTDKWSSKNWKAVTKACQRWGRDRTFFPNVGLDVGNVRPCSEIKDVDLWKSRNLLAPFNPTVRFVQVVRCFV